MKTIKKIFISVLTLLMCLTIMPTNDVHAVSLSNSTYAKVKTRYRGYLSRNQSRAYRITLDKAKKVKFTVNANGDDCDLGYFNIYNSAGDNIWNTYIEENNTLGTKTSYYTHYLPKGTYYITFENGSWDYGGNYYWQYEVTTLNRISQGVHNNVNSAVAFNLGKDYFDHLGIATKKNVVKFKVTSPGYYQLYGFTSCDNPIQYQVFDAAGNEKYNNNYIRNDNPIGRTSFAQRMRLTKGTYYIAFQSYYHLASGIIKFRVKKI